MPPGMMRPLSLLAFLLAAIPSLSALAAQEPDYGRDVRPILARNCFRCHGQDEVTREAGLRLDVRESAVGEADSGAIAIVPGDPAGSELYVRVTSSDDSVRMPPADAGEMLSDADIGTLKRWIEQGAPYADHWSFEPPRRSALPAVPRPEWARNAIDYFIIERLERAGLAPSPEAAPFQVARRLSLDLRGLPPTPDEVDNFVADQHPAAYERLVDRLLSDPAYGERWAGHWLDLARYADSSGLGSDPLRLNMWRYRDWVIDAFNSNMRFDRFTIEQLAGDLLPEGTIQQRMATALHRNTMTNTEGGTDDEEFRVAAVKDRAETTIRVWMGLTLQCANCHDHKYDPLSQRDYYRFFAVFNQTADADRPDEAPVMEAPTEWVLEARARIDQQVNALREQIAAIEKAEQREAELQQLREQITQLEKSRPAIPTLPIMQELPTDKRRTTFIMLRGDFLTPGEPVEPGLLDRFANGNEDVPADRLGAAKWLVDGGNPLVARVAMNRLWSQLFGTGLVETEEDFGTQGDLPSHPELLDWLAVEFVESGWDIKHMLRLMTTSAAYRQSAATTSEALSKDPRNRLLARGPRVRLDAEVVRDQALELSGLLSRKMHGPSVYPYQPSGLWRAAFNGERTWPTSQGEDRYRRGLYTFWRRTVPYPSMQTFDAPSREMCTLRRTRTNTPLQALVTLNDPVYVEAAQALARRICREGGSGTEERASFALRLCLSRPPQDPHVQAIAMLYQSERDHFQQQPDAARQMATEPLGPAPADLELAELAAWTVVANTLLNLDGLLTK